MIEASITWWLFFFSILSLVSTPYDLAKVIIRHVFISRHHDLIWSLLLIASDTCYALLITTIRWKIMSTIQFLSKTKSGNATWGELLVLISRKDVIHLRNRTWNVCNRRECWLVSWKKTSPSPAFSFICPSLPHSRKWSLVTTYKRILELSWLHFCFCLNCSDKLLLQVVKSVNKLKMRRERLLVSGCYSNHFMNHLIHDTISSGLLSDHTVHHVINTGS